MATKRTSNQGSRERKCTRLVPNRDRRPIGGGVKTKKPISQVSPVAGARAFAESAEAAVAYLEQRFPTGMEPLQRALAARIRHATAQLLACADQLDADELMVLGSTGQRIPHPLL